MNEWGRQFGSGMCSNCLYFLMRQERQMRPVCCSLCFLPVEEGNGSTLRVQQRCYSWMFVSLLVFNGQSSFEVIAVDACSSLIIIAVSSNLLRYVQSILTFSSPYSPKKTHRQTQAQIAIVGCCDSSLCIRMGTASITDCICLIGETHFNLISV